MGKTGTTALQNFFGENRKALSRRGICYPKQGSVADAHHLMSPYMPSYLADSWDFITPDQWAPKLSKVREDAVLLSSELVAWTEGSDVQRFCREVSQWFDLNIVIYLRRQDNIAMASYNQQVKVGQQIRNIDAAVKARVTRFDYLEIISPWAVELGKEKIRVCVYERSQFYKGDIRCDFMHSIFQLELDETFHINTANPNPRFSGIASDFKVIINNFVDDDKKNIRFNELLTSYSRQLDDSETPLFSDYSALSGSRRLELLKGFETSNTAVARQYLSREDGVLFRDPLPPAEEEENDPNNALNRARLKAIVRYLFETDRKLMNWLVEEVDRNRESGIPVKKFGVHILTDLLQESQAS
jgi:hypothetical protein